MQIGDLTRRKRSSSPCFLPRSGCRQRSDSPPVLRCTTDATTTTSKVTMMIRTEDCSCCCTKRFVLPSARMTSVLFVNSNLKFDSKHKSSGTTVQSIVHTRFVTPSLPTIFPPFLSRFSLRSSSKMMTLDRWSVFFRRLFYICVLWQFCRHDPGFLFFRHSTKASQDFPLQEGLLILLRLFKRNLAWRRLPTTRKQTHFASRYPQHYTARLLFRKYPCSVSLARLLLPKKNHDTHTVPY